MEDERGLNVPGQPLNALPSCGGLCCEPVAADPTLSQKATESVAIAEQDTVSPAVSAQILYDGSPHPSSALRLAFPLGKVEAYQSRKPDGTAYYDVRGGQNAFVLDGKAYFAGEEVK